MTCVALATVATSVPRLICSVFFEVLYDAVLTHNVTNAEVTKCTSSNLLYTKYTIVLYPLPRSLSAVVVHKHWVRMVTKRFYNTKTYIYTIVIHYTVTDKNLRHSTDHNNAFDWCYVGQYINENSWECTNLLAKVHEFLPVSTCFQLSNWHDVILSWLKLLNNPNSSLTLKLSLKIVNRHFYDINF